MTTETISKPNGLEVFFKYVSPLLAILTFAWGIYTYRTTSELQAESRRIEAAKPFLEKQLKLFTEATAITAKIATSQEATEIATARARFLELYWGELGMVERGDVASAMIAFKAALDSNKPKPELQPIALRLAHACREELAAAWETDAWKR
jgi:hypothetical protein